MGAPDGLRLRAILVALDASSLIFSVLVAGLITGAFSFASVDAALRVFGAVAAVTTFALVLIWAQGLYLARVSSVRTVELTVLLRVTVVTSIAVVISAGWLGIQVPSLTIALGCAFGFALLANCRGLFGGWLGRRRAEGRFCRRVVIVGGGDEGFELCRLLGLHPETGYQVAGVAGPRKSVSEWPSSVEWVGDIENVRDAVTRTNATGVLIAASDFAFGELNTLTRELARSNVHVQISSGLQGVGHRRLRALPVAHEPFFYVEPATFSAVQLFAKRALDILVASIFFVLVSPIFIASAIAIRLSDGGPALFRQTRIGRDGVPFTIIKLRTMIVNAESFRDEIAALNSRERGPLFKVDADPRRTRIGRLLERSSIDEIPQLWNVLRGEMSLVGPRPALPEEVAAFDDLLLDRHRVSPGMTGLWQVEGREKSAFDVYRRLDLFYIENWTVGLDLAILLRTVAAVALRASPKRRVALSVVGGDDYPR